MSEPLLDDLQIRATGIPTSGVSQERLTERGAVSGRGGLWMRSRTMRSPTRTALLLARSTVGPANIAVCVWSHRAIAESEGHRDRWSRRGIGGAASGVRSTPRSQQGDFPEKRDARQVRREVHARTGKDRPEELIVQSAAVEGMEHRVQICPISEVVARHWVGRRLTSTDQAPGLDSVACQL